MGPEATAPERRPVREIVVVDLWTDSNRGDNALQVALVRMLREEFPHSRITGVFRFGTNELESARPEIAHTSAVLDEVLGGIRRTYYSEANAGRFTGLAHQVVSLLSFLEAFACVVLHRLAGRSSARLVGRARSRTMQAISGSDLVVWKGKNFRDHPGATSVTRAMTLGGAGYLAGVLAGRIVCVNASFWPIRNRVAGTVLRRAFRRCDVVTVRDRPSVVHARDLLGTGPDVRFCADLSFALVDSLRSTTGTGPGPARHKTVGLTLTAWGDDSTKDRHLTSLTAALSALADGGAERVLVVPQVTRRAEDNSALVEDLVARVSGFVDVEVLGGAPTVEELLGVYGGVRLLVGGRMHSCVFARASGVPFVALAYDDGPKWHVLREFWEDGLVLPYDAEPGTTTAACLRAWREGDRLVERSAEAWDRCVTGSRTNMVNLL